MTNSYLAGGGDGLATLKSAPGVRVDTGYLEHDALAEHLKALGVVEAPQQRRVVLEQGGGTVSVPVLGPVSWLPIRQGQNQDQNQDQNQNEDQDQNQGRGRSGGTFGQAA